VRKLSLVPGVGSVTLAFNPCLTELNLAVFKNWRSKAHEHARRDMTKQNFRLNPAKLLSRSGMKAWLVLHAATLLPAQARLTAKS
jgi:hypothetical protein